MNTRNEERCYPKFPLVGVAGVTIRQGNILLIKRGTPPNAGEWNIPGGLVELGETLENALKREIREETGLEVSVETLLTVADRIIRDADDRVRYHYVLIDYLCHLTGGTLSASSDAADAMWVSFDDIDSLSLSKPVRETILLAKTLENCHG